jgi:hypothetical protein
MNDYSKEIEALLLILVRKCADWKYKQYPVKVNPNYDPKAMEDCKKMLSEMEPETHQPAGRSL